MTIKQKTLEVYPIKDETSDALATSVGYPSLPFLKRKAYGYKKSKLVTTSKTDSNIRILHPYWWKDQIIDP